MKKVEKTITVSVRNIFNGGFSTAHSRTGCDIMAVSNCRRAALQESFIARLFSPLLSSGISDILINLQILTVNQTMDSEYLGDENFQNTEL